MLNCVVKVLEDGQSMARRFLAVKLVEQLAKGGLIKEALSASGVSFGGELRVDIDTFDTAGVGVPCMEILLEFEEGECSAFYASRDEIADVLARYVACWLDGERHLGANAGVTEFEVALRFVPTIRTRVGNVAGFAREAPLS